MCKPANLNFNSYSVKESKSSYRDLVGFHMSITGSFEKRLLEAKKLTNIIQIFASNPRSLQLPNKQRIIAILEMCKLYGMRVIFHGPYTTNMVRGRVDTFNFTLEYIQKFYSDISDSSVSFPQILVLHTNKIDREGSREASISRMIKFLQCYSSWIERCPKRDFKIAIETDANSVILPPSFSPTTIDGLYTILNQTFPPNASICFDTEHSFASGVDILNKDYSDFGMPWERISVVHLNAIPQNVKFGSGKDRHSKTALVDSKGGTNWILRLIRACKERNIPMIFERKVSFIIERDFAFVGAAWSKL